MGTKRIYFGGSSARMALFWCGQVKLSSWFYTSFIDGAQNDISPHLHIEHCILRLKHNKRDCIWVDYPPLSALFLFIPSGYSFMARQSIQRQSFLYIRVRCVSFFERTARKRPERDKDRGLTRPINFLENWIDIYIIIFENMNYVHNPFSLQFYYIIVPAQTCPLPQPSLTECQSGSCTQINAAPKSQEQTLPAQIMVSREDLIREGYGQTKRAWSEQQDKLLMSLCCDQNVRFEDVAKAIPGRNAKMCYSRFRRLSTQSRNSWTRQENEKLLKMVAQLGRQHWKQIALDFPSRNHKQLKDHYENYLRPNLTTEQWTLQEDLLLVGLINQHGKNWKLVQKKLPHRSRNQIKNRLFGRILRIHSRNLSASSQQ